MDQPSSRMWWLVRTSRCRPAPSRIRREPQQRRPAPGRTGAAGPRRRSGRASASRSGSGSAGQVDLAPRQLDPCADRPAPASPSLRAERRPQVGVPAQQAGRPRRSAAGSSAPVEVEHELHGVDVRARRVVQGVEEQALLQRRQRQDVLQVRDCVGIRAPLRARGHRLRTRRSRPGRAATSGRSDGVRPAGARGAPACAASAVQRGEPALGELAHLVLVEQPAGPGPGGRQLAAVRAGPR